MRAVLCRRDRAAESAPGTVLPDASWSGTSRGLNSERAIAWRIADSMSVRAFLDYGPEEASPNHSTLSRTRRRIDVETHGEVFRWVLAKLGGSGTGAGEDDRDRRDDAGGELGIAQSGAPGRPGEDYERFVKGLAEASGVPTPTRKELVRFDRKRKKLTSNWEWVNPHDPEPKITKLKDGRYPSGAQPRGSRSGGPGDGGGGGGDGSRRSWGTPRRWGRHPPDGAGGSEGGRVGSTGPGSGDGPGIPQQRVGSGILEGTGIAGVSVGNGSRSAQLEGEEPEVPSAGVCESASGSGGGGDDGCSDGGASCTAPATVRASVRHGWVASDLRAGSHANVRKRLLIHVSEFQPGIADAPPDGRGHAPESSGPRPERVFGTLLGAPMDRWIGWNRLGERFWASIRSDGKYWASRTHQ